MLRRCLLNTTHTDRILGQESHCALERVVMMAVGMPNVITYGIVWDNPYRQEPVIVCGKLALAQLVKFHSI